MSELNTQDLKNLLVLLTRAGFNGIEEARAGLVLEHKIKLEIEALSDPPVSPTTLAAVAEVGA